MTDLEFEEEMRRLKSGHLGVKAVEFAAYIEDQLDNSALEAEIAKLQDEIYDLQHELENK